jgi:hypothetical protein
MLYQFSITNAFAISIRERDSEVYRTSPATSSQLAYRVLPECRADIIFDFTGARGRSLADLECFWGQTTMNLPGLKPITVALLERSCLALNCTAICSSLKGKAGA